MDQFSPWRYVHQRTSVHLPRTIHGAGNRESPAIYAGLDPDFTEAAFDHLDVANMSNGGTSYCADTVRTFARGA